MSKDRETIGQYFANITFSKVDKKEDYIIYGAAIHSSFGAGKKEYVLLFVPTHMAILDTGKITDLHWKSLQTRILTNGYRLNSQKWDVPRGAQLPMFSVTDRNDERSKYTLEGSKETEMILKHDPKKKTRFQYHNRMNLIAALATFMCVLVINDETKFTPNPTYTSNAAPLPIRTRYEPGNPLERQPQPQPYDDEGSFLPKIVCNDKYCYYESPNGSTSAPIKGYLPMGVSYGIGDEPEHNTTNATDDSFELL
jgi:hypothetical protein